MAPLQIMDGSPTGWALSRALAALGFALSLAAVAGAAERASTAACKRADLPGRLYVECLESELRKSDSALTAALAAATATIDARADLAVTQRTRWKNTLEEAQGLFVRFRNFDCQNVAPYEGGGGRIGAFEERLACLVDKNRARLRELRSRYGDQ